MSVIDKIKVGNTTYDIQDAQATAEVAELKSALNDIEDNSIARIDDNLYTFTQAKTNISVYNNTRLDDTGFYSVLTSHKTYRYPVIAGQSLKVVASYKCQFQSVNTCPSSGDNPRVGVTYGTGTHYLTVPEGANFLHVSVLKTDDTSSVYFADRKLDAIENRLLNDEAIYLLLEKEQDNIREIDINASFFNPSYNSCRNVLKVFNPTTLKGMIPSTPSASLYVSLNIGLRTLYLEKGDKIITNVDGIYNNSVLQLPNLNFVNGGYYGVILSTFQNNSDTDNGSVYFGRETFDGKWRILEIGVTGYYELTFRTDVGYTNKAYILHQHKKLVDHNDIVADITSDLSFSDGVVRYNPVTGWGNVPAQNIGSAGSYARKTVPLTNLTDYIGKSVLISGLDMHALEQPTANETGDPAIIYYSDGNPTTYRLSYTRYVYDKDYAAFPVIDGYDMRIQFVSTACLPFVRVWIVDNETLFKNDLVNPVFYGKKILGFGDSYIEGQGIARTWHVALALRNACEYVKKGYGGAGLCFGANGSLLNHLSELDEDADIYFLCFGRNDNSTGIKIGENDDELDTSVEWDPGYLINTATFKGAMNYLFNYIETRHPFAKIVTVTPWGFENNAGVTSGLSCLDYINAMQEISKKWGITCFNAAGDAGIHVRIQTFRSQYFLTADDQSHLNFNGHELMYKRAYKLLTNLMYDG